MTASLSRLQNFYGDLDASSLLRAMIKEEFRGHIALLTSFGADAGIMLALVAEIDPATPILFLETDKHFPETLDYARTLTHHFALHDVRWLTPDSELTARIDPKGELWQTQPNRCCWLRKIEPLKREVERAGFLALITGRKRYQTPERKQMAAIELDEDSIFRINPLATWDAKMSQDALTARSIPAHPLVAQGYRSIGCAPCTVPVSENADDRAGRWAHTIGLENEQKTECGIHLPASATTWSV